MKKFGPYLETIDNLLNERLSSVGSSALDQNIHHHLNGGTFESLLNQIPKSTLKQSGAFFTDKFRAQTIALEVKGSSSTLDVPVLDPTCGCGDLLLRCAEFSPLKESLSETLSLWSNLIYGFDIHPEFVEISKKRLILLATTKCNISIEDRDIDFSRYFKGIVAGDFLQSQTPSDDFHIVSNPPFHSTQSPPECSFASGQINIATLILQHCVKILPENRKIVALLPDVIRSGSRYTKLLKELESQLKNTEVQLVGKFSKSADVDVFILTAMKDSSGSLLETDWKINTLSSSTDTVADYFKVRVGPVVPHRSPLEGVEHPYITAKNTTPWETVETIGETRKFSGTLYSPPFIALRRTSNPNDKQRPVASVINVDSPCAVENHVIILQPYDQKLSTCFKIIDYLKTPECREWIDNRIRCRHLTVTSLKDLPTPQLIHQNE